MGIKPVKDLSKVFGKFTGITGLILASSSLFLQPATLLVVAASFFFTAFLTLLSILGIAYTFNRSHQAFMVALTGGTFLKLLFGPLYIFLVYKLNPNHLTLTVLSFLGFYLLFTGFEVYQLNNNLRPHFKKEKQH